MNKKPTVWKAQWPLSGEPFCLIYEDETRDRQSLLPATTKLFKELFQEKYVKVFFQGHVKANGTVHVDQMVRQEAWLPLPEKYIQPTKEN